LTGIMEDYYLIADSGSTKCDWALVNEEGKILDVLKTRGMNPYFHDRNFILAELNSNAEINQVRKQVQSVYFYGAGCSSPELNAKIEAGLSEFFIDSDIHVDHDLEGAAYACYQGKPEIACILGTGSNSCFFDGENVYEEVPSLAYILGDEGSGSYFGKKLIQDYFYKRMPLELSGEFASSYRINKADIIDRVYRQPHPNVFLASFMKFCSEHRDHPYIVEMIRAGMKDFLLTHVCCFPNHKEVETNFVGSVAHYFEDILKEEGQKLGVSVGRTLKKPVEGLVGYHFKYIEEFQS
jgi:glucosamine kinase